jgi:hypothetical protein
VYEWVLENCPGTVVDPVPAHTTAAAAASISTKTSATSSGSGSNSGSSGSSSSSGVILYGQSVGSGPTCYLAAKRVCAGVVLHSPIMSGMRVLTVRHLHCYSFDDYSFGSCSSVTYTVVALTA